MKVIKLKRNESIKIVFEDFTPSELWAEGEDNYPFVYHKNKFCTIEPNGVGFEITDGFKLVK